MHRQVVFRPEADTELAETRAWYTGRQPDLGERFAADIERTVVRITESPKAFPKVREKGEKSW